MRQLDYREKIGRRHQLLRSMPGFIRPVISVVFAAVLLFSSHGLAHSACGTCWTNPPQCVDSDDCSPGQACSGCQVGTNQGWQCCDSAIPNPPSPTPPPVGGGGTKPSPTPGSLADPNCNTNMTCASGFTCCADGVCRIGGCGSNFACADGDTNDEVNGKCQDAECPGSRGVVPEANIYYDKNQGDIRVNWSTSGGWDARNCDNGSWGWRPGHWHKLNIYRDNTTISVVGNVQNIGFYDSSASPYTDHTYVFHALEDQVAGACSGCTDPPDTPEGIQVQQGQPVRCHQSFCHYPALQLQKHNVKLDFITRHGWVSQAEYETLIWACIRLAGA